jgi:hypothetical protein
MIIESCEYEPDRDKTLSERRELFEEIDAELKKKVLYSKKDMLGHYEFCGVLHGDAKDLTEEDIAVYVDHGKVLHGGVCIKHGQTFTGVIYTS